MLNVDKLTWKPTRFPGIFLHPLWRDEASGDTAMLIKMQPLAAYPSHHHLGAEELLVLQGGFRDETRILRAGEFHRYPMGSSHSPVALDGTDCILFAIAHTGVELLV
jgi:anti-sigma factor ChrR (cupin superfamily)